MKINYIINDIEPFSYTSAQRAYLGLKYLKCFNVFHFFWLNLSVSCSTPSIRPRTRMSVRLSIYPPLPPGFSDCRNEHQIKQTLQYPEEPAIFQNNCRFSTNLGRVTSCDIVTTCVQPKPVSIHVRQT